MLNVLFITTYAKCNLYLNIVTLPFQKIKPILALTYPNYTIFQKKVKWTKICLDENVSGYQ